MKDIYAENYKILIKKIKMTLKIRKIFYALRLEELILLKWPDYPKKSIDFMQSSPNYS